MAERALQDLPAEKSARYAAVAAEISAVISGEPNRIARYASAACLLSHAFAERFLWTGFYIVDADRPDELVVGPYQGTLGCLRIAFGAGVCGAAAARRQTVLVADVHAFPGHIACDSRSNSEIVVPVFDAEGRLAAVLDVDSALPAAFDAEDQAGLEGICATLLSAA
ncbi:MAG: GAF domain-containing protein [Hyphomonadaceae bacterium]